MPRSPTSSLRASERELRVVLATTTNSRGECPVMPTTPLGRFDAVVHRAGGLLVIELEPAVPHRHHASPASAARRCFTGRRRARAARGRRRRARSLPGFARSRILAAALRARPVVGRRHVVDYVAAPVPIVAARRRRPAGGARHPPLPCPPSPARPSPTRTLLGRLDIARGASFVCEHPAARTSRPAARLAAERDRGAARDAARAARPTRRRGPRVERRQGRVPRDGLARAAHAAQRDPRLDAHPARPVTLDGERQRQRARDGRAQRARAGAAHRGPARRLAHHHGQAAARARRRSTLARGRRGRARRGAAPPPRPRASRSAAALDARRRSGRWPTRAAAAGRVEPAVQRGEVHARGRPRSA